MEHKEIVMAIKRGFDEEENKYKEALQQLGILHWEDYDEW